MASLDQTRPGRRESRRVEAILGEGREMQCDSASEFDEVHSVSVWRCLAGCRGGDVECRLAPGRSHARARRVRAT